MFKVKKGLRYLGQILLIVSLGLVGVLKYWELTTATPPFQLKTVLTGSMSEALPPGSLILIKRVSTDAIKAGDILSYQTNQVVVTHRVMTVQPTTPKQFVMKGDSNSEVDEKPVSADQILGKVVFRLPKFGWFLHLIQSARGLVAILLTLFSFWLFGYFLRLLKEGKKEEKNTNKVTIPKGELKDEF